MTDATPNVPLRLELTLEVPGTPDQVWDALTTADGISAWFLRTDLEERRGGTIVTHMGEDASSSGTVTGWDPPNRFAYEEPDWAGLSGHGDAAVTPLATEFLVEARSGGTCVVRVVSSAFGVGAEWEEEFFDEMERMWLPFFDRLRLYLAHFPGQRVTPLEVFVDFPGQPEPMWSAMRDALGNPQTGQPFAVRDLSGQVEHAGDVQLLVRLTGPVPGMLAFVAFGTSESASRAAVQGHLFSDDAEAFVEREGKEWQAWLDGLAAA